MNETVKLIIEIPKPMYESVQNGTYCGTLYKELKNGVPLDDVKEEIEQIAKDYDKFADYRRVRGLWIALEILDNIGKEANE